MADVVELHAHGHTATTTLPYDVMDAKGWHRRARIVYPAPQCIVDTYRPLASRVFATQCRGGNGEKSPIVAVGDVGLGFALDENRTPVVSVETAALLQLVQTKGGAEKTPKWVDEMRDTWASGQCLTIFHEQTGWRGAFSEHRLWSSILVREQTVVKTPYPTPTVRGWFPKPIIDDLVACVGAVTIDHVASIIADLGFDGAPDLVLWRSGILMVVEVKSATDRLRDTQVEMLKTLSRVDGVRCQVICPAGALKRMHATMDLAETSSDEE